MKSSFYLGLGLGAVIGALVISNNNKARRFVKETQGKIQESFDEKSIEMKEIAVEKIEEAKDLATSKVKDIKEAVAKKTQKTSQDHASLN